MLCTRPRAHGLAEPDSTTVTPALLTSFSLLSANSFRKGTQASAVSHPDSLASPAASGRRRFHPAVRRNIRSAPTARAVYREPGDSDQRASTLRVFRSSRAIGIAGPHPVDESSPPSFEDSDPGHPGGNSDEAWVFTMCSGCGGRRVICRPSEPPTRRSSGSTTS